MRSADCTLVRQRFESCRLLVPLLAVALLGCAGESVEEDPTDPSELLAKSKTLWKSPHISVCWEDDGYDQEKVWVRDAVRLSWEMESSITFGGWSKCRDASEGKFGGLRMAFHD